MKSPSQKELEKTFDLSSGDAKLIKELAKNVDDRDELEELVERVPGTEAYVRQMYSSPYDSAMWRRTVMLHAVDQLVGGFGVEPLGPVDMREGPPFEYINFGDTYATTLIYDRDKDELFIGDRGTVVEEHEGEWETEWNPKKLKAKLLR